MLVRNHVCSWSGIRECCEGLDCPLTFTGKKFWAGYSCCMTLMASGQKVKSWLMGHLRNRGSQGHSSFLIMIILSWTTSPAAAGPLDGLLLAGAGPALCGWSLELLECTFKVVGATRVPVGLSCGLQWASSWLYSLSLRREVLDFPVSFTVMGLQLTWH